MAGVYLFVVFYSILSNPSSPTPPASAPQPNHCNLAFKGEHEHEISNILFHSEHMFNITKMLISLNVQIQSNFFVCYTERIYKKKDH